MQEPTLAPDISILIDEQVLTDAYATVTNAEQTIATENQRVKSVKYAISQALDRVARKLLANPLCANKLDDVDMNHIDFTIEQYDKSEICFVYSFKEPDSIVTVYTWDSYENSYDSEIMSFPLNFVHRADWLANLEVWVEAAALKAERKKQEKQDEQEKSEITLLRKLMEKHQDKL